MRVVRTYQSLIKANQAAMFLRRNGVIAGLSVSGGGLLAQGVGLFIVDDSQADATKALLDVMEQEPVELASDWEQSIQPDLSRLPDGCVPRCAACASGLPRDAAVERCPGCGVTVDIPELVAEQFGPEAMDACYVVDDEHLDEAMGVPSCTLMLYCACGYSLDGLDENGVCPECGARYDKREILREILFRGGL